jgi:hypothetical protein
MKAIIKMIVILGAMLYAALVQAICPLCTIAVSVGIGFSKWLGIDDTITGLWIGGLTVSLIAWTINWLNNKNTHFKGRKILVTLLYYLIIVGPLFYPLHIIGHPLNKLWGMDKLLLGIIIGSISFFVANIWYILLKKRNQGHAYFPLQKVIMPVGLLLILSMVFYFITR